jgi:hypothetical protein
MTQQPLDGQSILIIEAWRSHSFRHTTLGRNSLEEWSARRRDLYLTTRNTHKTQTSNPWSGFEPAVPATERPQTHVLDSAVTGIGVIISSTVICRHVRGAGEVHTGGWWGDVMEVDNVEDTDATPALYLASSRWPINVSSSSGTNDIRVAELFTRGVQLTVRPSYQLFFSIINVQLPQNVLLRLCLLSTVYPDTVLLEGSASSEMNTRTLQTSCLRYLCNWCLWAL